MSALGSPGKLSVFSLFTIEIFSRHPVSALAERLHSEVVAKDAVGLCSSTSELSDILTNKDRGEDYIAEALAGLQSSSSSCSFLSSRF
jgi:hypothetical protein